MSQQVNVQKNLVFSSGANNKANVTGDMLPVRMQAIDWFNGIVLNATNDYTVTVGGTSDAAAVTLGGANGLKMTTGTGDNEVMFVATGLMFDATSNPVIETKVTLADVSGTSLFFGFSDADTETTPASTIDYADGTLVAAATDAVGFVCDADKSSSLLYFASIATGGSVAGVSTGITWTDGQTKSLRVRINSDLSADGFVDGVQVAHVAGAVTDVPFCAIFNAGTRANDGANIVTAKYLAKFQDQ